MLFAHSRATDSTVPPTHTAGVRSMGYAFALSPGRERESALSSIKVSFKECTDILSQIEKKVERAIGTISIDMQGIQGFARICPGDVFDITTKYGEQQKWKIRGKILKDGNQKWDGSKRVVFKALLDEVLSIKTVEVRGLGRKVTLGNKLCETRDLFSAHPQLMTINLNCSGTLKLNVIVTWNPLHGFVDEPISANPSLSRSSASLFGSIRSLPFFSAGTLTRRTRTSTLPRHASSGLVDASPDSKYVKSQIKRSNSASAGVANLASCESPSSGSTCSSLHLTTTSGFGSDCSYSESTSIDEKWVYIPSSRSRGRTSEKQGDRGLDRVLEESSGSPFCTKHRRPTSLPAIMTDVNGIPFCETMQTPF